MPRILTLLTTASLLTLPLTGLAGCSDEPPRQDEGDPAGEPGGLPVDGDGTAGDGDGDGDGDNTTGDGDGDVEPDPSYDLSLVGDEPVDILVAESRELTFQVVDEDGLAVDGAHVALALSGPTASLSSLNLQTDSIGRASVELYAEVAGTGSLTASTSYADDLSVPVTVRLPPTGQLAVNLESETRIETAEADLFVYHGNGAPSCASLADADPLPAADAFVTVGSVPASEGWTLDTGTVATVFAAAYSADGLTLGTACRDGLVIEGGATTTADVVITQRASVVDGDYDVLMHLELGDALPEPYEGYVGNATAVLSDPAGFAVYHALRKSDQEMGTSFVTWDDAEEPPYASYEEVADNPGVFNIWSIARSYVDAELASRLGQPYDDVTTVGGDLRDLVTDFEVGTRYQVAETAPGELEVTERWNALVFEWSLNCADGDLGCARHPVQIDDVELSATDVTYGALYDLSSSETETERFLVRANAHSMSLRYGAVITAGLNQVVYPSLPEGMAGDNLDEVIHNIIDCQEVGQAIHDAIGFGGATLYAGLCDAGLTYAASEIESQLVQLELGSDDPQLSPKDQQGAFGGGEYYLLDSDHDLATELVRDLTWEVAWADPENPGITDEINVPITGEGRLAVSDCDSDAVCASGESCQPVPSYLKVAEAETDCRVAVGALGGEEPCTADDQCASGVCLTDEAGDQICFAACTADGTCASGSCGQATGVLDLEPMMSGLGEATAQACGFSNTAADPGGMCENTCYYANDGLCDDGGPGSDYSVCDFGTDCGDCGAR